MKNRVLEVIRKNAVAVGFIGIVIVSSLYARFDTLSDVYARDMTIISYDYESGEMTLLDSEGFIWSYNTDVDDLGVGDTVACVMDRQGTLEIYNDKILGIY